MKIRTMVAFTDENGRRAYIMLEGLRSAKFGAALTPGGNVVVAYETKDGAPGPEVAKALREIADSMEKGGHEIHDVTPIVPEASA